ncbi:MAG TPA: glucose 1-dehydrogenase [Kofleriaceae bacterium]|jgi:NAD(P)-dependent dehydrogenase (short-subunit alcohol dehydrogenase family)|nr:glucose 1-dehydrogenase [Kofleriaceae bacterium]
MRFSDRVFLVTGGGSGIGRAIAKRLADEGARVGLAEHDAAAGRDAADEYGDRVRAFRCDVAREPEVRRTMAAVVRWAGRLDGVINNAGLASPDSGPPEKLTLATWRRVLDVNLTGAFLVAKHAIPHLRKAGGAIVNLGSTRALQSEANTIAYSASKGGIAALTHSLAVSLGPEIRVNCIEPGWIATSSYAPRSKRTKPRLSARDHAQHPAGRVGTPEDIASLCAWLLSEEAGFVTGATYISDGGMTRKMIYA